MASYERLLGKLKGTCDQPKYPSEGKQTSRQVLLEITATSNGAKVDCLTLARGNTCAATGETCIFLRHPEPRE